MRYRIPGRVGIPGTSQARTEELDYSVNSRRVISALQMDRRQEIGGCVCVCKYVCREESTREHVNKCDKMLTTDESK